MQVSIEKTSDLERRLTVGVPAAEIEDEVTKRLQQAAKSVRIDGFRRGKVPLKIVKQRFGAGVRQEVLGDVLNRTFQEAVVKENVRPAGQPTIEATQNEAGKDLEYVATFEVYPEVALGDFGQIAVKKPVAEVTDTDIDEMIEILRKQSANWEATDRAAAEGDQVTIDFVGRKDGEPFEGGRGENTPLELGSGRMIPGFEDAIVGMKAGDEKTVALTFPEDYHSEELKGQEVEFTITVNQVAEKKLPEVDDAFFARFGVDEGGMEAFRAEVKQNMERELRNAAKNKVKTQVLDQLLDLHQVPLPQALIQDEIRTLRQQMAQQFGGQQIDESMLPDELFKGQAERRVALGLLLGEVIRAAELTVDQDRVRETVEEMAATYQEPEQVVQYYMSNPQLLQGVEASVLEDQVVEYLLEKAQVEETASSYQDVIKQEQPAQAE